MRNSKTIFQSSFFIWLLAFDSPRTLTMKNGKGKGTSEIEDHFSSSFCLSPGPRGLSLFALPDLDLRAIGQREVAFNHDSLAALQAGGDFHFVDGADANRDF